jgi:DeoR/GlpR family transcriptional regulator of sugar metabolism
MNNTLPIAGTDARRLAILELLKENKVVRVADLSRRFGVSEVSIRRDMEKLDEYGLLRRVHGGAVALGAETAEPSYDAKSQSHLEEKRRIGQAAAALIQPGDRIILDSGTTVMETAREIARRPVERKPLTVITASFPVFRELSAAAGIHLIVLGGLYLSDYQTLVGPQTLEGLRDLHVDKLFLGADGLSVRSGVTTANLLEAEVSKAMARAASEVIVVTDASKINNIGFTTIIPLASMHQLITDAAAPSDFSDSLRQRGIQVTLV